MKNYRGSGYRCGDCGAAELKLWRQGSSSCIELRCATCAVVDQRKAGIMRGPAPASGVPFDFHDPGEPGVRDSIGDLVPAIPTHDGFTFWSNGCANSAACAWWYARPTYADERNDLIVERILRAYYFERFQDVAATILRERRA